MSDLMAQLYDDSETLTLSIETTSKILGIARQTTYKYLQDGYIPGGRKIGGTWVVYKHGLRSFLEGKEEKQ